MIKVRLSSDNVPLLGNDWATNFRFVVPFSKVAWLTVSLPFFGFFFCILWSVLYNFEHSTSTHCNVYNFLPSVSAAIGHYKPQSHVWKLVISMQAVVRVLVLFMYYYLYKETVYRWARGMSNFTLFSYILENAALVTLSFWSSNDSYEIHKLSFITFLIMSLTHMGMAYMLMQNCRNVSKDSLDAKSLKWKFRMIVFNVASIFMACYFFYRHNSYCEPFVYSLFALSEYSVVVTNMGFHLTAALDFPSKRILISSNGFRIIE